MKNLLYCALFFSVLSSCSGLKLVKTLKQGELKTETFQQVIPFNYRLGLIIIPVEIEGKNYQFLLDTGAPNVVSTELAEILKIENGVGHKTSDSQGAKSQLQFITIDEILIGGIKFERTAAAVADLSQSNEVACLKIDGIIGSNLMRLCKWKIDYAHQQITIVSDLSNFGIDSTFSVLKFEPELTGTPKISIDLDGTPIENVKFDTGSAGFIDLPLAALNKIKKSGNDYAIVKSFGVNGSGLFGAGQEDTMYYAKIEKMMISDLAIKNRTVEFVKDHSALLGTQFFKHFTICFDWQRKEIYLQKVKEIDEKPFESFGFNFFYDSDKLLVKELFENSEAQKLGLKNGDQIISMNGKDFSVFSKADWCELLDSQFFNNNETIELIIQRENQRLEFTLLKEQVVD